MSGKNHLGGLFARLGEGRRKRVDDGFGAQIASADAYTYHCVATFAHILRGCHDVVYKFFGGACRQVYPSDKVVAGTGAVVQV